MGNVCSVSFGRPGRSGREVSGGETEHSPGVLDILRNASNYGIPSLLLMEAKATHLESERPARGQEGEDLRLELLHCTGVRAS